MLATLHFRCRIFRCLLGSSPSVHFPFHYNGNIKARLTELPSRHYTDIDSFSPLKQDKYKYDIQEKVTNTDAVKGRPSVSFTGYPSQTFNNCFSQVDNYFGGRNYSLSVKEINDKFSCELTLTWPSKQVFVSEASSRKKAIIEVKSKALLALWKSHDITSRGTPVLVKNRKLVTENVKIELGLDERNTCSDLLDHYKCVQSHIELAKTVKATDFGATEDPDYKTDVIYNIPRNDPVFASLKKRHLRSLVLKQRGERPRIRAPLPIDDFKTELIEAVENHRIILLRAETGSGKSSRYPQFIFDHYASLGKGGDCNIVVTQPRRLPAVSLARYVAQERNEALGDVVGYSVRMDSVVPRPPGGCILYVTAGKLLQSLVANPDMEGISHICLDEVHERLYSEDFLMGLVRRVLRRNPKLHVTLMSATLDPKEFQKYFGSMCHVFDAPGRCYPVKTHFLDDIPGHLLQRTGEKAESPMIARIIRWLDDRPPGGILVFLPGWKEIHGVKHIIESDERFFLVVLHSNVPLKEQCKVHDTPPRGKRKVVLATNIAESSITISDIVYVVDFPYERITHYSYEFNELVHELVPCPSSRLIQRRGRAGRCQPGHCYHLLKEEVFEELPESTVPQLLQMSLEYPVLLSRCLTREESIQSFFADLLTPPDHGNVANGIKGLQELGALDSEENFTPLGKRLTHFAIEPRAAKALVLSTIFQCENTVSAYCAAEEFFPYGLFSKEPHMLKASDIHPSSDHMVMINLLRLWIELTDQRPVWERLITTSGLRISFGECASAAKFMRTLLSRLSSAKLLFGSIKISGTHELQKGELLNGILLNVHGTLGLVQNYHFKGGIPVKKQRLKTLSGKILILAKESTLAKQPFEPSSFIFHHPSIDIGDVVLARCYSLMSPLSVLLFMPGQLKVTTPLPCVKDNERKVVSFKELVKIEMSKSDCEALLQLREALWECVDYFILKEGSSEMGTSGYDEISEFRNHLIEALENMLQNHTLVITPKPQETSKPQDRKNKPGILFAEEETWQKM